MSDYLNNPVYGGYPGTSYTAAPLPPPAPISAWAGLASGAPYSTFMPPQYSPVPVPQVQSFGPMGNAVLQMAGTWLPAMFGVGSGTDTAYGGFNRHNPLETMMGRDWYRAGAVARGVVPNSQGEYAPARDSDIAGMQKVFTSIGQQFNGGRVGMVSDDLTQLGKAGQDELANLNRKMEEEQAKLNAGKQELADKAKAIRDDDTLDDSVKRKNAMETAKAVRELNKAAAKETTALLDAAEKFVKDADKPAGFKSSTETVSKAAELIAKEIGNSPNYGMIASGLGTAPVFGDMMTAAGIGLSAMATPGMQSTLRGMGQYGMFAPNADVMTGATSEFVKGFSDKDGKIDLRLTRGMSMSDLAGTSADLVRMGLYRGKAVTDEDIDAKAKELFGEVEPITAQKRGDAEGRVIGQRAQEAVKGWTESMDIMKDIFGDKIPNLMEKLNQMTSGTLHQMSRQQAEKLLYDVKETAAIAGVSSEVVANIVQFAAQSARARGLPAMAGAQSATYGIRQAAATQAATQGAVGSDFLGTLSQEEEAAFVAGRGLAGIDSAYGRAAAGVMNTLMNASAASGYVTEDGRGASQQTPQEWLEGIKQSGQMSEERLAFATDLVAGITGKDETKKEFALKALSVAGQGETARQLSELADASTVSRSMQTTTPQGMELVSRYGIPGLMQAQKAEVVQTIDNLYAGNFVQAALKNGVTITEPEARVMRREAMDASLQGDGSLESRMKGMTEYYVTKGFTPDNAKDMANTTELDLQASFKNPKLQANARSFSDYAKQNSSKAMNMAEVYREDAENLTTLDKGLKNALPTASANFVMRMVDSYMSAPKGTDFTSVISELVGGMGEDQLSADYLAKIEKPLEAVRNTRREYLAQSASGDKEKEKEAADAYNKAYGELTEALKSADADTKATLAALEEAAKKEDTVKAESAAADEAEGIGPKESEAYDNIGRIAENTDKMAGQDRDKPADLTGAATENAKRDDVPEKKKKDEEERSDKGTGTEVSSIKITGDVRLTEPGTGAAWGFGSVELTEVA